MMKSIRMILTLYLSLLFSLAMFVSCENRNKVRKYREKEILAKTKVNVGQKETPLSEPGARVGQYQWDTPEGWSESTSISGMRLATFSIKSQNRQSICTIIPLKGEAGGLKANVMRWLGQINVKMEHGSEELDKFLASCEKFNTKGQFPAVMIDFTTLKSKPSDNSILATVITVDGNSVFIKMTGEKSLLIENKEKFKVLCHSFTSKQKT